MLYVNEPLKEYEDVLYPKDLQKILRVGRNTVYRMLLNKEIKSIVIAGKYKIPKIYLLEYLYPDQKFGISMEE
ncbi:MAG: helix-turn-helix domain-containing protein [Lachnospiraceae bacterium]|nr:helix-turn-helix domain-containing protein [Lachnospiraceae bacterium]